MPGATSAASVTNITETQPGLLRQSIAFVVRRPWITKFFRE